MKNEIGIFNPLPKDFPCKHSEFGSIVIPSKEIVYVNPLFATFIKTKLYTAIVNYRNLNGIKLNADPKEKQKIFDEMEVNA